MLNRPKILDKAILTLMIIAVAVTPLLIFPDRNELQFYQESLHKFVLVNYDNVDGPKIHFLLWVELILLIIVLIRVRRKGDFFRWDRSYLPLLLFFGWLTISAIASPYGLIPFYGKPYRQEGLLAYLGYLVLFFVFANFINSRKRMRYILGAVFISGSLISIIGLMQFFGIDLIINVSKRSHAYATLGNPNFAGSYLMLVLPAALVFFFRVKKRGLVYLLGICTALFYSFMITTQTRSGWLAFAVILPVIVVYSWSFIKRNYRRVILLALALVLITFGLNAYQGGNLTNRAVSIYQDGQKVLSSDTEAERGRAGSSRFFIYQHTLPLLKERPLLGSGLDTFARVFPQDLYREFTGLNIIVDKAHSEYLQLAVTAGIPALLLYLWFLISLLRRFPRRKQANHHSGPDYLLAVCIAGIAYLIQASFNISVVMVAPLFWSFLGLVIAAYRIRVREAAPEDPLAAG